MEHATERADGDVPEVFATDDYSDRALRAYLLYALRLLQNKQNWDAKEKSKLCQISNNMFKIGVRLSNR